VAIKQYNLENTEVAIKQDNLEKLVIKCTQDEEKQNKSTTQYRYALETTMHKQTQILHKTD